MGFDHIEATCYFCPNECRVCLAITKDKIVVDLWQCQNDRGTMEKKRCPKLKKLLNKHQEVALAMLRGPRTPHIVVGGH